MRRRDLWMVPIGLLAFALIARAQLVGPTAVFVYPDSFYYADLGRQHARGEGFSTLITFPYIVSWMGDAGVSPQPPWPNVARFPLISVLYAPAFAVFGASPWTVYLIGATLHMLTAAATFLLGARLFGIGAGIVAALFFAGNVSQKGIAASGLLELPAAFCLVASTLLVLSLLDGTWSRRRGLALGILLGLSFLLRFDLLAMTVGAVSVLVVGRGRTGVRQAAWVLLGAAIPPGLWMLHNWQAVGSAFVFLGFDRNVLGSAAAADPYTHHAYRSVWSVLAERPEIVTSKLPQLLWPFTHWRILFGWDLAWIGPAFLLAFVVLCVRGHRAVRPATFLLVTMVARSLIFSVTHHEPRFYTSYTPLLLVFVIGVAWMPLASLLRLDVRPRLEVGLAVLAGVLYVVLQPVMFRRTLTGALADAGAIPDARVVNVKNDDVYRSIRERTPRETVFATSQAEAMAWYADRPAIRLGIDGLRSVEDVGLQVDGLMFLTRNSANVERALQLHGWAGQFVRVLDNGTVTVWLRRPLVSQWERS